MIDRSRHATTGRFRAPRQRERARGLPQVYSGRARRTIKDIYEVDQGHASSSGRFRWLISTCLAATVGVVAIGIVLYGSIDRRAGPGLALDQIISEAQAPAPAPREATTISEGLNWVTPKSDRLYLASAALTARYTIHEQVQVRRNNRPFIQIRPYLRISMRLVPASRSNRDVIPPFNPFKLYSVRRTDRLTRAKGPKEADNGEVKVRVVELLGGILPGSDGHELETNEVENLVLEANEVVAPAQPNAAPQNLERVGILPGNLTPQYLTEGGRLTANSSALSTTTVIYRTNETIETDDPAAENSEIRVVRLGKQTALRDLLVSSGTPTWQAAEMTEAASSVMQSDQLPQGYEARIRLIPSLTRSEVLEPDAFTIFGPFGQHIVTVKRSASGEFTADSNFDPRIMLSRRNFDRASTNDAILYASLYDAGLTQRLSPDQIMKIMRIHAYEVDFRKRIRDGDQLELFYELKPQTDGSNEIGELLYAAITASGDSHRFWRFRSKDGAVEYYDENGQNSKKFLMRKPVRGGNVRLTSGFGYRRHPLLNERRMHNGIDWAAPRGTPILAAGRGVIEEARRRGTYGNYIRIKHANGYQTAYSHMRRFAPGIRPGVKVRQGQLIGYVGSTGLSSGPHLHYEILVNNRFVNPLKISVPQARTLKGRELAAFHRERNRIEELMRRAPVRTASR